MRLRLQEEIDEKEQTLKNTTELLKIRQWVINAFESGIFPTKTVNVFDDVDVDYFYDGELYPEGILTTKIPATPPIILDPPPGSWTQRKGIKILPPKQLQPLQRLLILVAQVQTGNTSEILLNELVYYLFIFYRNCNCLFIVFCKTSFKENIQYTETNIRMVR